LLTAQGDDITSLLAEMIGEVLFAANIRRSCTLSKTLSRCREAGSADFMTQLLETHDVIRTHAGLGEYTAGLIIRGYTDDEILAILGGNFMRLFRNILG